MASFILSYCKYVYPDYISSFISKTSAPKKQQPNYSTVDLEVKPNTTNSPDLDIYERQTYQSTQNYCTEATKQKGGFC